MSSASLVQASLDAERIRPIQMRAFALCILVTMLDGIDNQSIGVVAPLLSKDLGIGKAALGTIFSVTQIGATIGALMFGMIGDRAGRKTAMMLCVGLMTVFTLLTALVPTFEYLVICRFFTGLGLAGVFACALALASEYAPGRLRGTIVSIVFAGYPAGATLGGVMAAGLLSNQEWRAVLYVATAIGVVTLILLSIWLPESVRFLVVKGARRRSLHRILEELGVSPDDLSNPVQQGKRDSQPQTTLFSVFRTGLGLLTILLCLVNLFVSATTKIMVVWFPTILTDHGFTASNAALAQASFNFGCFLIQLIAGWLVDRFGALKVVPPALALGGACVAALGLLGPNLFAIMVDAAFVGALVGAGAAGAQAMASRLFPVPMRSTGIGWCTSAGRFGQILSPMLVGLVLASGIDIAWIYGGLSVAPLLGSAVAIVFVLSAQRSRRPAF